MAELRNIVEKIRSKNAGPFWLTVDIFCGSSDAFDQVRNGLSTDRLATAFNTPPGHIKRFDIETLNVIKFSLPRPHVQGSRFDPDMHGASWAALLGELELN